MTDQELMAAGSVEVGQHPTAQLFGLTFNIDTIVTTVMAGAIVVGLGLFMRARATSGVPSGLQLAFEAVTGYVERQVDDNIGLKRAPFVVPLAVTLFVFIVVANWFSIIPGGYHFLIPPTSDVNLVYALALLVIGWVHVTGIQKAGLRYGKHFLEPKSFMLPLNIIEEFAKPVSLSLRLFGNIFAGVVMVTLIGLLPPLVLWLPDILWKLFELFIGVIQAFIFALLTIIYFSFAAAPAEEAHS